MLRSKNPEPGEELSCEGGHGLGKSSEQFPAQGSLGTDWRAEITAPEPLLSPFHRHLLKEPMHKPKKS